MKTIQNFINRINPELIPLAKLKRFKRGYSNKRVVEAFKAMMIEPNIQWQGKQPVFLVPYCKLALSIGLGHGLGLVEVIYPAEGYFADPEHTIDETFELMGA